MSREVQLAGVICRALDQGAREMDPVIAERLRAMRERAVRHQPEPVTATAIVDGGGTAQFLPLDGSGAHPLRTLLAILALLFGVAFAYYWNGLSQAVDNGEIDSALLTDELPPNAYLDRGFQAWLEKNTSLEQ